jgi:DNA repair protein RecN (Recombination protein N)
MALKRHLEQLSAADAQAKRDLDYNQFLFDELSNAALSDGEQEELEQEASLLANTESIKQSLSAVLLSCDSEEGSALSLLNAARSQLSKVASFHKDLDELYSRLESNIIELGDILATLSSIDSNLNFSPDRQEFVNTRLDLIYRLQKKHSVQSVAELLAIQQRLEENIQAAEGMDSQVRQAMEEVDKAYAAVQDKAEKLSAIRRLSAQYVEQQLLPTLAQLGMKEARLSVVVSPAKELGPLGGDIVSFLFNANRGGELRELSKVASGGELSRLMLAIKSLVTQQSLLPTIIFDEIDTGVSGDISVRVGNILHSMASHLQVIAITHLPQIAARASAHLKVFKQVDESGLKTVSRIKPLAPDERIHEVAVMLSSEPPSPSALQTASELMSDNIK